jgi:hypothetical protein
MRLPVFFVLLGLFAAGCSPEPAAGTVADTTTTTTTSVAPTTSTTVAATTTTTEPITTTTVSVYARPDWLGTRLLPLRPDGFGEVLATPQELQRRAFETPELLPPPAGVQFELTISEVPDEVLARSTWREGCPVTVEELSYITVSHWGFDQEFHTGEMIVNAAFDEEIVGVFEKLHAARFPVEEMRVITQAELDAHPTGDGNVTTSFVCRPAVGSGSWSRHAYGLAVDINPFHNPYLKGDLVLPELATYYLDRSLGEPGMLVAGDVAVEAFTAIGWTWAGTWTSLDDWMHFSDNGR